MNLEETGWEGADWINLSQDRYKWQNFISTVMNVWVR